MTSSSDGQELYIFLNSFILSNLRDYIWHWWTEKRIRYHFEAAPEIQEWKANLASWPGGNRSRIWRNGVDPIGSPTPILRIFFSLDPDPT